MKITNLFLIAISLMLFSACTKDPSVDPPLTNPDGTPVDPNTYKPGATLFIDDLVLYTSDGAHRDVNLIKSFVNRNFPDHVNKFFYGVSKVSDHKINQSLLFLDNNRVKLNGTIMEIVSKTDTQLMLSPLDSTNMPGSESQLLGRCMLLHEQVPQYNPYSICNTAGGNCKKYRKQYPVIISGKDYYVPILNFAVVSTCNIFTYNSTPMPNHLNPQISNGLLKNKDSVLVQVARLPIGK
ncbi:MAG TPA: hypothetical protein VF008_07050 [Niastella sp.]